jgi:hypothetical protein
MISSQGGRSDWIRLHSSGASECKYEYFHASRAPNSCSLSHKRTEGDGAEIKKAAAEKALGLGRDEQERTKNLNPMIAPPNSIRSRLTKLDALACKLSASQARDGH